MKTPEIFEARHKVRTYECDTYGHVNNAVYLNYLEYARMLALEEKGFTLERLKNDGFLVVVRKIDIEYRLPASEGDLLLIRTHLKEHRNSSGTFRQEVLRETDNKLIVMANVTWVFINLKGKPIPIPDAIRQAFRIEN